MSFHRRYWRLRDHVGCRFCRTLKVESCADAARRRRLQWFELSRDHEVSFATDRLLPNPKWKCVSGSLQSRGIGVAFSRRWNNRCRVPVDKSRHLRFCKWHVVLAAALNRSVHFFRDYLEHQRRHHERIAIPFRAREIGANFAGEMLIDSSHADKTRQVNFNERGRPLPHVIVLPQAKDVWPG